MKYKPVTVLLTLLFVAGFSLNLSSETERAFHTLNYSVQIDQYSCFSAPYPRSFGASVTLRVKADSAIHSLQLNADTASLVIDSVSLSGVDFLHQNHLLTIGLDRQYDPGEVFEVRICYHHRDITDHAFFAGNGMVFTNCEPEGARKWFPCHDVPDDKATFDLTARTPRSVLLASNGALTDSTVTGDTIIYHWVSTDPVATYLVVIAAATDYNLKTIYWHKPSNPSDSVPVRFYYRPGEVIDPVANAILPLADFFSGLFCDYPFQKAGFASMNELFYGGGMENQTLITLCSTCWRESLAAHEFAHMWFGDLITCSAWSDLWLNEGFATWSTVYWQEHQEGYASYKSFLIERYAKEYLAKNPGWAISDSSWAVRTPSFDTLFNVYITYMKGACAVHQLRYLLGDPVFLEVLKTFTNNPALRFKSATIGDMMKTVKDVAGADYDWYFRDWIFSPNHPKYQNRYDILEEGGNTWKIRCLTSQTQAKPAFFRMLLPFRIVFADSSAADIRVMNDVNDQLFTWTFTREPVRLIFDPDTNLMLKEATTSLGIHTLPSQEGQTALFQNVPNPATDRTEIPFRIQEASQVTIEILDLSGKVISVPLSGFRTPGRHILNLDCSAFRAGTYFVRMVSGSGTAVKKMVITGAR